MAQPEIDYTLYLVTDRDLMALSTIEETVERAIEGGTTLVQLREKHIEDEEFIRIARNVKEVCDAHQVPLIINDNVEVARVVDAAGVHVGQDDMPCQQVRAILGPDKIIGVSASTFEEAVQAERDGADYLGVGAMFPTSTKDDADITSVDDLKKILATVKIPSVLIGGINAKTIPQFREYKPAGYAVVSAIMAAEDPARASQELRSVIAGA